MGCGNGTSLLLIHNRFKNCHGVDITESSLNEFNIQINKNQIQNCSFSLENIDHEFCENKFYDRIISFEVLEHVENDINLANQIYNKLKPGGLAAISIPNKWWIFETHGAYLPFLPWNRIPFFSWLPKPIHDRYAKARIYKKKEIKNILENSGFDILKQFYITAPMDIIPWKSIKWFLRGTIFKKNKTKFPFLATSIMTICQKPK